MKPFSLFVVALFWQFLTFTAAHGQMGAHFSYDPLTGEVYLNDIVKAGGLVVRVPGLSKDDVN
jgi:hypothetical protein